MNLRDVSPRATASDLGDGSRLHAVHGRDHLRWDLSSKLLTDHTDFCCGEFRLPVLLASLRRRTNARASLVLARRHPLQVLGSVVVSLPVLVVNFVCRSRRWSEKGKRDEAMHVEMRSDLVDLHGNVAVALRKLILNEDLPVVSHLTVSRHLEAVEAMPTHVGGH